MRDRIFSDFIVKRLMDSTLSDEALDAIQNGEMSGLLKCFYNITAVQKHIQFESAMKIMEKFLRAVSLEDIVKSNEFVTQDFIMHTISGSEDGIIGFSGSRGAMRLLALDYVEREQEFLVEDQQITTQEIIDSIESLLREIFDKFNAEYGKKLSGELTFSDMISGSNATISSIGGFYILTFKILGKEVNMILGLMSPVSLTVDGEEQDE